MVQSPASSPAPSTAPTSGRPAGDRRLLLLVGTVVSGVVFGLIAAVAFAAWSRSALGPIGALVVGLGLAWVLPLFLAVRAALALKRRRPASVLLRRLVALFLVDLVQVTVFLLGFTGLGQGAATTGGELAAGALPLFGEVPRLGPWLHDAAREGHAVDAVETPGTTPGKDPARDPGRPPATTPGPDGGTAGTGDVAGLQPRTGGRPTGVVAVGAQTTDGDLVVVVWQVLFGGQATPRVVDLAAFAALGAPTRVESASDGSIVAVLGGSHVVVAGPTGEAVEDKAVGGDARVGELEIQRVRDVAIGPGGTLLLAVDAFDPQANRPLLALIARPPGAAAFVVRKAGDVVDGPAKEGEAASVAHSWSIKRNDGRGAVVVEEEFLEGGTDVGTKLTGPQWTMNPRRLLAGQIENPRALAEIVRTGVDPSGVGGLTLQAFGDAVLLPDGRVFFDANYVEDGARGWIFSARAGGGAFALGPELVGKPEAPLGERAPRVRHFVVDADGSAFAFVNRDGAAVLGPLARPVDARVGLLRAEAVRPDGSGAGTIGSVGTVRLASSDWVVAGVDVVGSAGARNEAVVLAGRNDLTAGKAGVLLEVGGLLPANAAATSSTAPTTNGPADAGVAAPAPRRVKSIFFDDGHDEALWHPG